MGVLVGEWVNEVETNRERYIYILGRDREHIVASDDLNEGHCPDPQMVKEGKRNLDSWGIGGPGR